MKQPLRRNQITHLESKLTHIIQRFLWLTITSTLLAVFDPRICKPREILTNFLLTNFAIAFYFNNFFKKRAVKNFSNKKIAVRDATK